MGSNSVKASLSKEDIISDIILMQGVKTLPSPVFLIVEGRDDIRFFLHRIGENVNLYESYSGCQGVREIVKFFSAENVIGICDRDYDRSCTDERVFLNDYSCLEMMMISNNKSFESVCANCYMGKTTPENLRFQILSDLKVISFLRKINFDDKLGINFNRISISSLYNKQKKGIDTAKIKTVLNCNILVDKRLEIDRLNAEFTTYEHFLYITNGHDFMSYLQLLFEADRPPNSRSLSVDMLFVLFSTAFRNEDFASTSLYKSLKKFESIYCLKVVS